MVGFQKQNLEVQKNVNSGNQSHGDDHAGLIGRNLQTKSFAKFEYELLRGLSQTNSKFANKS